MFKRENRVLFLQSLKIKQAINHGQPILGKSLDHLLGLQMVRRHTSYRLDFLSSSFISPTDLILNLVNCHAQISFRLVIVNDRTFGYGSVVRPNQAVPPNHEFLPNQNRTNHILRLYVIFEFTRGYLVLPIISLLVKNTNFYLKTDP